MKPYFEISLHHEPFFLLPQKALYRPLYKQLILCDIHLGKASHFRKQGIPIPEQSHLKDLDAIHFLLDSWRPDTVIILGDLFHSDYNREWLWFKSLLLEYPRTQFSLVEGNHDILADEHYNIPNLLKIGHIEELHLLFTHHPVEDPVKFNICGHLHPGVYLHGTARQSVKLPCFYKSSKHLILPAFGSLTGMQVLQQEEDCDYFLITGGRVIKL